MQYVAVIKGIENAININAVLKPSKPVNLIAQTQIITADFTHRAIEPSLTSDLNENIAVILTTGISQHWLNFNKYYDQLINNE